MQLSSSLLIGALVIGVLLLGGLGASLALRAGGIRPTSGAPGMMGPGGQPTQGPSMMGTPGQGGMMGGSQPSPCPTGAPAWVAPRW